MARAAGSPGGTGEGSRKSLIEKRVQRTAPAAQRRLAGEPKARPDASLPRSEINQFLPASRFIFANRSEMPDVFAGVRTGF